VSAYLVVPLFALANAGVALDAAGSVGHLEQPGAWGVPPGLLVAKLAQWSEPPRRYALGWGHCPRT
jgi:Na+/H+ antiporter NhaA